MKKYSSTGFDYFGPKKYETKKSYIISDCREDKPSVSYDMLPPELSPISNLSKEAIESIGKDNKVVFDNLLNKIKNDSIDYYNNFGTQKVLPKITFSSDESGNVLNWVGNRYRLFISFENDGNYIGLIEKDDSGAVKSYLNRLDKANVYEMADLAFKYVVSNS